MIIILHDTVFYDWRARDQIIYAYALQFLINFGAIYVTDNKERKPYKKQALIAIEKIL
jgi:hypothetical protein